MAPRCLSTEQHRGANDSITRHASKSEEQADARGWRRSAILFVVGAIAWWRSRVGIGLGRDVDVGSGGVIAPPPMIAAVISTVVPAVIRAVISAAAAMSVVVTGGQCGAGADCESAYRDCQSDFGGEFADSCAPGAQTFVIGIFHN